MSTATTPWQLPGPDQSCREIGGAGMYVGVARARHRLAFVHDDTVAIPNSMSTNRDSTRKRTWFRKPPLNEACRDVDWRGAIFDRFDENTIAQWERRLSLWTAVQHT